MCATHLPVYVGYACAECEARWSRAPVVPLVRVMVLLGVTLVTAGMVAVAAGCAVLAIDPSFNSGIGFLLLLVALPCGVGITAARACDQRMMRPRFLRPTDPASLPPARVVGARRGR